MAGKTPNSQGIVMDSNLCSGLHKLTLARLLHRIVVCSVALLKSRHILHKCMAQQHPLPVGGVSLTEFALREMWSIDSSYHMNSQQNHIPLKKGRLQTLCKVIHCAGCVLTNTKPHQLSRDDREMGPATSRTKYSQVASLINMVVRSFSNVMSVMHYRPIMATSAGFHTGF